MRAVILSAVPCDDPRWLASNLEAELTRAGYDETDLFDLSSTKLAYCQGEFDCWVKTPGVCRSEDAATDILAAAHDADAMVFFGPLTFGGYSPVLKPAIDRLLSLLEPFFVKRQSLTHHALRYERHQSLFTLGWTTRPTQELAETFAALNDANGINYLSPQCRSTLLDDTRRDTWAATVAEMLASPHAPGATVSEREPLRIALFGAAEPDASSASRPKRAALLIGSPKAKGTSASEAMARALQRRLEACSIATELHFATELLHDNERSRKVAAAIAACDLFALVTPLYVDSFPSVTTHALELVARARAELREPASFVVLVNCGFPEPEHNRTALRIARHFADDAGYAWGGGLPLGGGGVVAPDMTLEAPHGPVAHVVRALDLAAPALASSGKIPHEALVAITSAVLPDALYRAMGDLGWRYQALKHGVSQADLHRRPRGP